MSAFVLDKAAPPEDITLLFFTAGGTGMAVEASQISGMMNVEEARSAGIPLTRLGEMIALPGGREVIGKALIIKGSQPYGIIVDRLDEMAVVEIDRLRPMPHLAAGGSGAIWGACLKGDEVLLLIDLQRLAGPAQAECEKV